MLEGLALQHRQANRSRNFSRLAGMIFFHRFPDAAKPEPHDLLRARIDRERIMGGALGSNAFRINRVLSPANHEIVDAVFHELMIVRRREKTLRVGFVFSEKKVARIFAMQLVIAERGMACLNGRTTSSEVRARAKHTPAIAAAPCP